MAGHLSLVWVFSRFEPEANRAGMEEHPFVSAARTLRNSEYRSFSYCATIMQQMDLPDQVV
jgi:hypothetical protein